MNYIENQKSVFVINPPSQCPLRSIDATKIKNYFLLNNFVLSEDIKKSDYIIYVTCSVSPNDVENALKTIEELKKYKAELIVMGCMPGANLKELRTGFEGLAIATKNINDIDVCFPNFRIKFDQVQEVNTFNFDDLTKTIFHGKHDYSSFKTLLLKYGLSSAFFRKFARLKDFRKFTKENKDANVSDSSFIVISNGCANNCSYCNIRNAVGKIKSKSIENLLKEYSDLIKKGYRVFHFLADDISSYGLDIKSSLIELLNKFSEIDNGYNVKWSLHGMNPAWLVKNEVILTPYFATKKIWDITIAMESGSDRIIKLMNRQYKSKEVESVLKSFRKLNPGLRIDALFFVGFPTETDDDFNQTIKFIKNIKFDNARVSYYYEFDYLPAANLHPKVSKEVMEKRILLAQKILKSS